MTSNFLFHRFAALAVFCILSACAVAPTPMDPAKPKTDVVQTSSQSVERLNTRTLGNNFRTVVTRVEPVAERICRERSPGLNCDFRIVVDDRENAPPNAFQTVDENGRPIIAFTLSLISVTRNQDELAFVMAHEAAHHIQGHLQQQQQNATLGALILGQLVSGAGVGTQRAAQRLGASLGVRSFSKDFELEADALGTRIAAAAGYDPVNGAAFFTRIPDPGNSFLGTHPANADRIATVQRVAASL